MGGAYHLNWREVYQRPGLSPQPMIRRARSAVSLLRVYGGQGGVVPDHLQ